MGISSEDIADLWFLVRKSASLMDRAGEAIFREGLGISLAQFMVLSIIDAHAGSFNQQTIADLLGLTKGTVSRQLEAASEAGLLTTEVRPTSRREKIVALTPAGTALVRRGDTLLQESNRSSFPDLDPDDLAATLRTLSTFARSMDPSSRLPSTHGVGRLRA